MRDETPTSNTGDPQYRIPGKHVAGQRHRAKAWEALVVATGLAISAALYPLPAIVPLLEFSPPKYETSDFPALVRSAVANRRIAEASGQTADLTDLVDVIDNDVLVLRTDALLELVNTRGLPDSSRSLELLRSFQSLTQGHPLVLSGGGGGAPVNVPSTTLPELWTLLELLLEALPTSTNPQLAAALTELLPLLAQSLGLAGPPGVAPLNAKVFTQDETTVQVPLPQPTVTATVVPDPATQTPTKPADASPQAPAPAPPAAPAPAPTQALVPAPVPTVETPASSVAPSPEPVGTPTATPTSEPTNTPTTPSAPDTAPGTPTPTDNGSGPTDVSEPDDDRTPTTGTPSGSEDDDDKEPANEAPNSSDNKPTGSNDKPGNDNPGNGNSGNDKPKDKPDNGNSAPGN